MSYHEVTKMVITTIIKFLTRSHMSTQQSLYWLSGLRWHMYERCACKGQLKANIVVVAFTYLPFLWPELYLMSKANAMWWANFHYIWQCQTFFNE